MNHYYGMKSRGCAPMCQPYEGLVEFIDTDKHKTGFYSVLRYNRKLTKAECDDYELVNLCANEEVIISGFKRKDRFAQQR